jgi:hypothetical protein
LRNKKRTRQESYVRVTNYNDTTKSGEIRIGKDRERKSIDENWYF